MTQHERFWAISAEGFEVDENLPPGCGILDQPPFIQMLGDPSLFPSCLIKKHGDIGKLLRLIGHAETISPDNEFTESNSAGHLDNKIFQIFNPGHNYRSSVVEHLNQVLQYCRTYYPFIPKYLYTYWIIRSTFNQAGQRTIVHGHETIPTYAAYQAQQTQISENVQWLGLEEVLPSLFSDMEELTDAMPPKPRINRQRRFHLSGAFG